jgi:Putative prokaryotic signal transducing protein
MAMIDPDEERRRLAEVYSHQTDGELEQAASQGGDLTDIALHALREEMAKRGLTHDLLDGASDAEHSVTEFRDLVVIRSYWNLLDAELAKGALNSAGIECFLFDDNIVRMDWFNANAMGGVKLRVDPQNVEAANRILDEAEKDVPAPDEPESESES